MKPVATREKESACARLAVVLKRATGKQDDNSYYKKEFQIYFSLDDINIPRFIKQVEVTFIIHFVNSFTYFLN